MSGRSAGTSSRDMDDSFTKRARDRPPAINFPLAVTGRTATTRDVVNSRARPLHDRCREWTREFPLSIHHALPCQSGSAGLFRAEALRRLSPVAFAHPFVQQLAAVRPWTLLLLALSLTRTPAVDLPADRADHFSLACEQKGR